MILQTIGMSSESEVERDVVFMPCSTEFSTQNFSLEVDSHFDGNAMLGIHRGYTPPTIRQQLRK
jgi:hypothetical protein